MRGAAVFGCVGLQHNGVVRAGACYGEGRSAFYGLEVCEAVVDLYDFGIPGGNVLIESHYGRVPARFGNNTEKMFAVDREAVQVTGHSSPPLPVTLVERSCRRASGRQKQNRKPGLAAMRVLCVIVLGMNMEYRAGSVRPRYGFRFCVGIVGTLDPLSVSTGERQQHQGSAPHASERSSPGGSLP